MDLLSLEDLVRYTHSLMSIVLEPALREQGYTYVQTLVLLRLRDGTAVYPKEISAQIRYDNGALTRVIDQLVDRGLLERMRCDQDRRTAIRNQNSGPARGPRGSRKQLALS